MLTLSRPASMNHHGATSGTMRLTRIKRYGSTYVHPRPTFLAILSNVSMTLANSRSSAG
jgi:hypothetical protein